MHEIHIDAGFVPTHNDFPRLSQRWHAETFIMRFGQTRVNIHIVIQIYIDLFIEWVHGGDELMIWKILSIL